MKCWKRKKKLNQHKKIVLYFPVCVFFCVVFCSFILFMCDNFCHKDMGKNSRKIYWQPSYIANRILSYNVCNNKPTKKYILYKYFHTFIYIYEMETHDLSYSFLLYICCWCCYWCWDSSCSKWWWRRSIKELCCTK